MDITRLRTCTLKSRADFYYDSSWSVGKLLNEKPYMVLKTYYESEKISFSKEVTDKLKEIFPTFFEIEKPGVLKKWEDILFVSRGNNWANKTYSELLRIVRGYKMNGKELPKELVRCFNVAKGKEARIMDNSGLEISKRLLQAKNHGR